MDRALGGSSRRFPVKRKLSGSLKIGDFGAEWVERCGDRFRLNGRNQRTSDPFRGGSLNFTYRRFHTATVVHEDFTRALSKRSTD